MPRDRQERRARKPPPPLDQAGLSAIAIRYVERYQTSRARLVRHLEQKLRQRGWAEGENPPDPAAVADRMVEMGYVNDEAFAQSRARGLARRGMGAGRVAQSLAQAGIDADMRAAVLETQDPRIAALDFARRKRLGPFGPAITDQKTKARQLAAFARAGHAFSISMQIVKATSEDEFSDE